MNIKRNQSSVFFKSIYFFVPLFTLLVWGCSSSTNDQDNKNPPSKMALPVPSGITASQINMSQLRAYLVVDNGDRLPMTITQTGDRAERSVTLDVGMHTFEIIFEYANDTFGNTNVSLAAANLALNVQKGTNTLAFSDSDFSYDSEPCDTDGFSNLLEISKGSNPCDSGSLPDVTPPTTTATTSPSTGPFLGLVTVTLTCSDGSGAGCGPTYYTLDNTEPTINSPQYSVPLTFTSNTTLKFLSVDLVDNFEEAKTENYTIIQPPAVSGVWWLKNTPAKPDPVYTNTLCSLGSFNPRISVVQDIVNLTATDDTGVQYTGTLDDADGNFTLNGSKSWSDANNDTVIVSVGISGQFIASDNIAVSMTRSASIGGSPDVCSETSNFAGAISFQHSGENYTGLYGGEVININMYVPGELTQSASTLEFEIQGDSASMYIPEFGKPHTGSFNASTGAYSVTLTNEYFVDDDGEGLNNDLVHQEQMVDGLFVGSPDSSSTSLVGLYNGYRSIFRNTPAYDPELTPDRIGQDTGRFYGKQVATSTITETVLQPDSGLGTGSVSLYKLVLNNPPLKRPNPDSQLAIEVIDPDGNPICSALYQDRFKQIALLPHLDFKTEQFQGDIYSSVYCDVTSALNTTTNFYTVNIGDGTTVVDSYPLTATPAPFPDVRPDYRAIDVNGMTASQTQQADPLPLRGYFNLYENLLLNWPQTGNFVAGLTLQNYELKMIRQDEPMREYRLSSPTNSATIPPFASLIQGNSFAQIQLVENFVTTGGAVAKAVGRGLEIYPGIRGLFNIELIDTTNHAIVAQLSMDSTSSNFPNVRCGVTRIYDTAIICDGQVDLANNQFIATITDTITSEVFTLTADYTNSATADVVLTSVGGSAAGQGEFVNTELESKSVLTSGGSQLTAVDIKNPDPLFNRGRLISASGQNLGNGSNTPLTLWNNNYVDVYLSYEILPIDNLAPQTFLTNIPYRSSSLLNADTFTVELTDTSQPEFFENYSVSYQAPDPTVLFQSGLLPPTRTQFTINGVTLSGPLGSDTLGSSADPIVLVEGNPITIAWTDTTNPSIASDIRWRIAIRSTASSHEERRSQWMSSSDLNFIDTEIEWTAPENFTANLLSNLPGDAQIYLRIRDSADTVRGAAESIYVTLLAAGSNAPPIAVDDIVVTNMGLPVTFSVLPNDVDFEGDTLSIDDILQAPQFGQIDWAGGDSFVYTPQAQFTGVDGMVYQISDIAGNTDTANVIIYILP